MKIIGVYPYREGSIYIERIREVGFPILPIGDDSQKQDIEDVVEIILDYTEFSLKDVLGEICESLLIFQQKEGIAIIVLVKESTPIDRRVLLKLGANLILSKDMDIEEVELLVRNLSKNALLIGKQVLSTKDTTVQLDERNLSIIMPRGDEVTLTRTEYKVMTYLKKKKGQVVSYDELDNLLWGKRTGEIQRTRIANVICHLRLKIEENPAHPKYIQTVRTVGYLLRESEQDT